MQVRTEIAIISLEPCHIPDLHRLSAQERWPHRPDDWAFLLKYSLGFGVVADERIVATGVLTPYGEAHGTCNMIIVEPSVRGTGLGRRLMQAMMDAAGNRECRLVATDAGRPLYEKFGYKPTGLICQYQGLAGEFIMPESLATAGPDDLDAILALDLAATGMDRHSLLTPLLCEATVLLQREGEEILGYAAVRRFGRGQQIGPIIARNDSVAKRLLQAGLAHCSGHFARFDLTEAAAPLQDTIDESGLGLFVTCVAMTRPGVVSRPHNGHAQVYALASQALG